MECANRSDFDDATSAAAKADLTVLVMGLDSSMEGEGREMIRAREKKKRLVLLTCNSGHDRKPTTCTGQSVNIYGLPGCQHELVAAVAAATTGPVVLVLMHGGAVSVAAEAASARVGAIIDTVRFDFYVNG